MRIIILTVFGLLASSLVYADPLQGIFQAYEDWELVCDNTGTCRAAGFSDNGISLLVTRKAGPDAGITATVFFAQQSPEKSDQLTTSLIVNHKSEGILTNLANGYFLLNEDQSQTLVTALLNNEKIEFSMNGHNKLFSVTSPEAVIAKIDDFQQRSGTESAQIHTNTPQKNHAVLPPQNKPVIITQPIIITPEITSLSEQQLKEKIHWLPEITEKSGCKDTANDIPCFQIIPVTSDYSLITMRRNQSSHSYFWLTDNHFKRPPRLITTDATEYREGRIYRSASPAQTWVWNGHDFVLSNTNYDNAMQGKGIIYNGIWSLPLFVSDVITQQEVDTDNAALNKFYQTVLNVKKSDPELAPENIAVKFPLSKPVTEFTISYGENNQPPHNKVAPGITDDEWQAFLRSEIIANSDSGRVSFKLVDLDGDGRRDLIINSSEEDDGLFSYTGVLRQGDGEFYATQPAQQDEDLTISGTLFSENERGANQWSRWIEINGQLYALWINGAFGEDNLYLLRPFSTAEKKPVVTIHYTYQFSDLDSEDDEPSAQPALQPQDKTRLLQLINTIQKRQQAKPVPDIPARPLCPIPPATAPEDTERYSTGISLNYDYEHVADVPVWLNSTCYIGTITSHFGAYEHGVGVDAEITLVSPEKDDDPISSYTLSGLRSAISVDKSYKNRQEDEDNEENSEIP